MTARSAIRCGCERSREDQRAQLLQRLELVRGDPFRAEVGRLVAEQVERQPIAVLGQEAASGPVVDRAVEREAVGGDDANDVVANACRIAKPPEDPVGEHGTGGGVARAVHVGEWLAEIVQQACEPHLE